MLLLKLAGSNPLKYNIFHLHFTMLLLKRAMGKTVRETTIAFTFHYASIKTLNPIIDWTDEDVIYISLCFY